MNENGGGGISEITEKKFQQEKQPYVPTTSYIHNIRAKEANSQMTRDPDSELENKFNSLFGVTDSVSHEASYKPDIVLLNGLTGAQQTASNLQKTQKDTQDKLREAQQKVDINAKKAFEGMSTFSHMVEQIKGDTQISDDFKSRLDAIKGDDVTGISQELKDIQIQILGPSLSQTTSLGNALDHELAGLFSQYRFMFSTSINEQDVALSKKEPSDIDVQELLKSDLFLSILIKHPEVSFKFLNEQDQKDMNACNQLLEQVSQIEEVSRRFEEAQGKVDTLNQESNNLQSSINKVYEYEYDRYEKMLEDDAEDNKKEQESNNIKTLISKDYQKEEQSYADIWDIDESMRPDGDQRRSQRVDTFLDNETGDQGNNLSVYGIDTQGNFTLKGELAVKWVLVDENRNIQPMGVYKNQREANRAEIRYRLFSTPPLHTIVSGEKGLNKIDELLHDKDILHNWSELNPDNPGRAFRNKELRRILLIAIMKNKNPDIYKDMSYQSIIKGNETITKAFHTFAMENPAYISSLTDDDILRMVRNPDIMTLHDKVM